MRRLRFLAAVVIAALAAAPVAAQEFPTKPVELVLPFGPGGSHDLTARAVASVAHQYLGQPLLVVLKPGGGGAVGSQHVIRAKPDGYTLLFGGTGPNTVFALVQKAPIGVEHFTPVARINHSPAVFAVRHEAPWKTLREAIEYAKKNPGKFSFANTGPWGAADYPMRLIARAAGIDYTNVPHDGGGPALLAVLGGHADATFGFAPQLLPQIMASKMRALAVSGGKRFGTLRNVPTVKEEGFDVNFTMWRAVLAPKGTPPAIVEKLEAAFRKMSEDKSFQALIKQLGDEVDFQGAKDFEATWRQEWDVAAKVVAGTPK
ncbi:MAG: tripartite tricarboxylate transporter substrate binding protein [Candidatus Rokubacteria bacterium]|nr:tripartite tricarboxylate transporter substrate binding protein [Candidatus Rokubacteria bacterium]MBI2016789.1 tripartite tricarboxylate transporter substrate binding protein [Candidatus Rokubacteria bacterium]MBI2158334.1 tripartite tricarboxylate transporter substrate binding protein [Candidatus Rokubacteria bacterium]